MLQLPAVHVYASDEPTARETTIEQRTYRGTKYSLKHRTAGVEPLFRAHKFSTENWGVTFYAHDGARNGRWCLTEDEARKLFDRWTTEG